MKATTSVWLLLSVCAANVNLPVSLSLPLCEWERKRERDKVTLPTSQESFMSPLCKFMDLKKKKNTGEEKRKGKRDDEKNQVQRVCFLKKPAFF